MRKELQNFARIVKRVALFFTVGLPEPPLPQPTEKEVQEAENQIPLRELSDFAGDADEMVDTLRLLLSTGVSPASTARQLHNIQHGVAAHIRYHQRMLTMAIRLRDGIERELSSIPTRPSMPAGFKRKHPARR